MLRRALLAVLVVAFVATVAINVPYVVHGLKKVCLMTGGCRMDTDLALEALVRATAAMYDQGLYPVMSEGTALGLVRDGGIIVYDDDVDMVLPTRDRARFVERVLPKLAPDFHVAKVWYACRGGVMRTLTSAVILAMYRLGIVGTRTWDRAEMITIVYRNHVYVDVSFVDDKSGCEWGPRGRVVPCPSRVLFDDSHWTSVRGWPVRVPGEQYLRNVYGSDWRTPRHRLRR
jgi:hypothetical protein